MPSQTLTEGIYLSLYLTNIKFENLLDHCLGEMMLEQGIHIPLKQKNA